MAICLTILAGIAGVTASDALASTGSISGNVTGAPSHTAVAGVEVCALKTTVEGEIPVENKEHCAFTGSDGNYEIGVLEPGTYLPLYTPRVAGENYLRRYYNADGQWPPDSVTVGDAATTGIDTELPEGGSIKGRMTEELDGKPLGGLEVCAGHGWEYSEPSCVLTDADGRYEIIALATDIYTVKFIPEDSGLPYFGESYDDEKFGSGYPQKVVSVNAGSVTEGIDAVLRPSAEVRGTVTVAATGAPLARILVCIAPERSFLEPFFYWNEALCSRTNSAGAYSVKKLATGQYEVLFSLELQEFLHYIPPLKPEEDGYPTRYWNEEDTLPQADLLNVTAPTLITGIDARLGPPPIPSRPFAAPAPPAVAGTPRILKIRCKAGRHLRKIKGKRRCVRRHPKHRRHSKRARQDLNL